LVQTAHFFALGCLALFSLADLRYRTAPGAGFFFLAAVLIAFPQDPRKVGMIILAVGWGISQRRPAYLALPLLLHPSTWAVVMAGVGVRKRVIGRFDLFVLAGVACLLDWPVPFLALVGMEIWRRFWRRKRADAAPALPGIFLGVLAYLIGIAATQAGG
jgi:hypothetical protein